MLLAVFFFLPRWGGGEKRVEEEEVPAVLFLA